MNDDFETRLGRRFAHLAPSPSTDADLVGALATADQLPMRGVRLARRIRFAMAVAAAVALVGLGFAYSPKHGGDTRAKSEVAASPNDGRTLRVRVDANGAAVLEDTAGRPRANFELGGEAARASDGLRILSRALEELSANAPRTEDGTSTLAVEIVPSGKAMWRWMQWILQAAAGPHSKIGTVRFGLEGASQAAIEQRLPADRGIVAAADPRVDTARVVVSVMAGVRAAGSPNVQPGGATISLKATGSAWIVDLESAPAPAGSGAASLERTTAELTVALRTVARSDDGSAVTGEIDAPPPRGVEVPYEVVVAVLRAFRQAGFDDVQFGGAPAPRATSPR